MPLADIYRQWRHVPSSLNDIVEILDLSFSTFQKFEKSFFLKMEKKLID